MSDFSVLKKLAQDANEQFPALEEQWSMVCTPTVGLDLIAEIERLERNRDMWKAQVERQAEELTALRKDAERYRFLRSDLTMGGDVDFCIVRKHWKAPALESILSLSDADEQIDVAMNK